ncbi:hypothetical protein ACFSUS_26795 [Spirosoma soli]|uniref:DUF3244 domain-containing protein n=1 Tax=Spirosoma soli TaxID=1770529 RepID=A0ABW5MCP0_9BACT
MFPLMSTLVTSFLLSAATLTNPTTPKGLSFDASAFVTASNKIRLAVSKTTDKPVVVLLRNKQNEVLYQHTLGKQESAHAFLFCVNDLTDGQYELEIKSSEGSIRKQVTLSSPTKAPVRIIAME